MRKGPSYEKLIKKEKKYDDPYVDYEVNKVKIPWKGITLALFLTITGLILLCMGILSAVGYLDEKYSDRTSAFLMLGLIMFIPGAYHIRIAFLAYSKCTGFSYDDIPDFD